ncbi:MAG: response regulator [Elusimicrobia bacterium]|nr:response regulator [Elusimicrobiota bacterium]
MTRKKILVVDDDPAIRKVIHYGFSEEYSVFEAPDGAGGVEACKKHKPELVFLDMELPDSSGIDLLDSILDVNPRPVVVMLTGNDDMEVVRRALQRGAAEYVTKPFQMEALHAMVKDRLGPQDRSGRPWRIR